LGLNLQQDVLFLGKTNHRGDQLFVVYMDVGMGREQDAEAFSAFTHS
jgi:hypothetical protein